MNAIFIILLMLSIIAFWASLVFYGNVNASWTVKQAISVKIITSIFSVVIVVFSLLSFSFIDSWRVCVLIMFAIVIGGLVIYLDAWKHKNLVLFLLSPKDFRIGRVYSFVVTKIEFYNGENLVSGCLDMQECKYKIRAVLVSTEENVENGDAFKVKIVGIEIIKNRKIPYKKRILVEQI